MSRKVAFRSLHRRLDTLTVQQMELAEDYFDAFMQRVYPMHEIHRCADDIRHAFLYAASDELNSLSPYLKTEDDCLNVGISRFVTFDDDNPLSDIAHNDDIYIYINRKGVMGFQTYADGNSTRIDPFDLEGQINVNGNDPFYNHSVFVHNDKQREKICGKFKYRLGLTLNTHGFSFTEFGIGNTDDSALNKIFELEVKKQRLTLYALKPVLNKNALKAMNAAQIYGPVFYNWLCGTFVYGGEADDRYVTFHEFAKQRQNLVINNPTIGHIIGVLLCGDNLKTRLNALRVLNNKTMDFHELLNSPAVHVVTWAAVKSDELSSQMKTPQFWINDIDVLEAFIEDKKECVDKNFPKYLHGLLTTILTHKRQKSVRPQLIPGGVL